ncbi:MAG TPA: C-terminal binding protein, partial [Planctomycetaceae bacterium]|nr:C-terminal binding protein [Planctomycetaceae bacterium]
ELVSDADAVITQFAPVNAAVVNAMQKARAIVRYGIGFDNVACDAARAKQIPVCNIPDYCIDEVADHTLAFILSATRGLRPNCTKLVNGEWGLGVPLDQMRALRDQAVGIVGLGRIGKAVAERLRAFKCRLLAFDPVVSPEDASRAGCSLVSLDDLLSSSDIVTLHCPSNEQTRGIINAQSLANLKPGAILINVGRGDLVKLEALAEALSSGRISAAALDVFETEPLPGDSPLLKMENVIVSAHVASASVRAVRTLRETAARIALAALRGESLPNIVNGV